DLIPAGAAPQGGADADQLTVVCLAGHDLPRAQQRQGLVGVQGGGDGLERAPVVLVDVLHGVERGVVAVAAAEEVQAGGGGGQRELCFGDVGGDAPVGTLPPLPRWAKLRPRVTLDTPPAQAGRYGADIPRHGRARTPMG